MEKESPLPVAGGHGFSLPARGSSCPIPALSAKSSRVGGERQKGGRVNMGKKPCSQLYSEMPTLETRNCIKRLALSQISTYEDS